MACPAVVPSCLHIRAHQTHTAPARSENAPCCRWYSMYNGQCKKEGPCDLGEEAATWAAIHARRGNAVFVEAGVHKWGVHLWRRRSVPRDWHGRWRPVWRWTRPRNCHVPYQRLPTYPAVNLEASGKCAHHHDRHLGDELLFGCGNVQFLICNGHVRCLNSKVFS